MVVRGAGVASRAVMSKSILLLFCCPLFALGCTEVSDPAPEEGVVESAATVSWCTPASPTEFVSRTVTCEGCNRNDVEACARAEANSRANDYCETQIPNSGGDAACDPAAYTNDICVDDTSTGVTSSVQFGSDTACGIWPFRHAKWRVSYRVSGDCGYFCREEI